MFSLTQIRFNSILVWLKEEKKADTQKKIDSFQFHSGLIKRQANFTNKLVDKLFQFHSGLIKSYFMDGYN